MRMIEHAGRGGAWLAGCLAIALVGCGDDDGAAGQGGFDAGDAAALYCDDVDGGVIDDPSDCIPRPFIYEDVPEPYPEGDVNACKAFTEADEGLTEEQASRRECFCDACIDLMRQCDALPGCTEMRQCAWRTGCNGPYACYLLPTAPCRTVIDKWGNGSVSAALNTELADCGCR